MAEATSPTSPAASVAAQEGMGPTGLGSAAAGETAAAGDGAASSDALLQMVSSLDKKDRAAVANAASNAVMNELRERRKALGKERAELTRAMRNEQKKKSRLLDKAQRLSNNDLLEVFAMRVKRSEAKAASSGAQTSTEAQP